MNWLRVLAALSVAIAITSCFTNPIEVDEREAFEHQSFEHIKVYGVPQGQAAPFGARLSLTVSAAGTVSAACVRSDRSGSTCHSMDAQLLKDVRYRPFLRNGAAIPVKLEADAVLYPEEKLPNRTIPFPPTDLSTLLIELRRGPCYGSCPSYSVSIDGSGNVVYNGNLYTALGGEYQAKIPVSAVRKLVGLFAAANFYSLDDEYTASVTDNPTHFITFAMSGRSKTVADYVGLAAGMPKSAFDLEAAIDAAAGTERWVHGTAQTVDILKARGFDFTGKRAREMLIDAIDRPAFAKALIVAGVPATPDRTRPGSEPSRSALAAAIGLGDREMISLLLKAGAAAKMTDIEAGQLLQAAARNVDPGLIKLVLSLAPASSFSPEAKVEALKVAIEYNFSMVALKSRPYFNKHAAVAVVLEAGADPNRLDPNGETILEWISDPQSAAQLIKAGADPNRRNKNGQIPLLSNHNDETTLYLMQVTKPGVADAATAHALRKRAYEFKFAKVLAKLPRQ